jgi:hypothetical protein
MISFVAYKLRVYMEKNKNSQTSHLWMSPIPLPVFHSIKIPLAMQKKRERMCKDFSLCVSVWKAVHVHVLTEREIRHRAELGEAQFLTRKQQHQSQRRPTQQVRE